MNNSRTNKRHANKRHTNKHHTTKHFNKRHSKRHNKSRKKRTYKKFVSLIGSIPEKKQSNKVYVVTSNVLTGSIIPGLRDYKM